MEWLQSLLDNSTTPALIAFLLGLLTAVSPCPLATNIAAIGYIGKEVENRKTVFRKGLLYTLGRIVAYTALGCVLIMVLEEGASLFGIQKVIGKYGEMLLPPVLLLIGLFMLFGNTLNLPQFGFKGSREGLAKHGNWGALWLGMLFAMAFCPTSGYFLFRHVNPHVHHITGRLSAARIVCGSNGTPGFNRCVDTGIQCAAHKQFLREGADRSGVAELHRRRAVHSHRGVLCHNPVSVYFFCSQCS